ncbi:MAG: type IV pilus assembly protein PilM [Armatimonadota bacterium]|nr:type IV pilus assembly protein PilM [Armatimonadota bacterium]MDR7450395.1 type IV pilus assembly protein PilM [Armatimonadota bacterium]MDR7467022.1 type IV pilus assembly protein PilM [Armatimonadota bacterium]MDR7493436.1 type IV pilus assembly protein PilM [Armatimonadota bacterium]MDR7498701.1 type IV pilus assembly protein PilM [Armatimonadota bacterium]
MGFFGPKSYVGVDIGSRAIKVVELAPAGQRYRLLHAGMGETPAGTVKEREVVDPQALGVAIRQVLSSAGVKAGRVVSAVGGQAVIVRELKLPPMSADELRQAARYEAERYIPYALREVNMDFDVIGETVEDNQKKVVILLVAARQEIVDKHVEALAAAGLQPFVLDVESFAVMRALNPRTDGDGAEAVVVVDLGAETTDIIIMEGGQLRLTRNLSIGGDSLTKAIAARLDMEFKTAEQLKEEKGAVLLEGEPMPDDRTVMALHDAMLPILGDLATEIRRSMDYFQTRWRESRVRRVVLSGGTARLTNLDRFLSLELGVETVVGDPFAQCEIPGHVLPGDARRQMAPALATAVGLAMRGAAER